MKLRNLVTIAVLCISCNASKEKQIPKDTSIDANYLEEVVSYLASDELKGRNTGTEGIDKAGKYIANQFSSFGIYPYLKNRKGNNVFMSYYDEFEVPLTSNDTLKGTNIVAILEGTDKNLKNEYIILGAHYDHIGEITPVNGDSIANGANDNAAGTSAVLSLAKYFSEMKNNKRSIIFALFSAEEKGLLGSKHLSEKLKKDGIDLYAMINFEMIGVPMNRDYKAYISGYDLSNMALKINESTQKNTIGLLPKAKSFNLFKRSDNYPFYLDFKVPSQTISTFDFENYDYYHHVKDESQLMNYDFMASLLNEIKPAIVKFANTKDKELKMYE